MSPLFRKIVLTATAGALLSGGALAQATTMLPPVHKFGSVEYLSGGIGLDESRAIEHASPQWPLTLEFAAKDKQRADFLADVKVRVRDAHGKDTMKATSDGPFLLAKLPPGQYVVDATLAGKKLSENIVIKEHGPTKAVFVWPGEARSKAS
ncbi:carboxypeptidase regulatory-like domain-containing protein [Variovorax sp. Sphag1AA]|uniref:carboxypeptidase regulatory-like domain-containing protein n=1 Tax=Variovorax sp. Sphag1AA TaxID=2587027 RepID=UPI001616B03D|nr:carboxypeptidase regulatory-like domain-containing protein [Variovorax sp. Sphag1AA]MBB3181185.1 hypothetical protein [Variovorax sp. Sphag1AA]